MKSGVHFDLNGDGDSELTSWTESGDGNDFLALDRNLNGTIDDGRELFGTATLQPSSHEPNGFLALAVFDSGEHGGNGDGQISAADRVFEDLRLWIDLNHDGVSQASELVSLQSAGIAAIDLNFQESTKEGRYGNKFRYRAKVYYDDGRETSNFAYDVFLLVGPKE